MSSAANLQPLWDDGFQTFGRHGRRVSNLDPRLGLRAEIEIGPK